MALAHAVGDKVEAAYCRGDLLEKRRRLIDAWAAYCAKPANSLGDVRANQKTPMHKVASFLLWRRPEMEQLFRLVGGAVLYDSSYEPIERNQPASALMERAISRRRRSSTSWTGSSFIGSFEALVASDYGQVRPWHPRPILATCI
jgi:hypothetical protein